jgi:hypothetical protein
MHGLPTFHIIQPPTQAAFRRDHVMVAARKG